MINVLENKWYDKKGIVIVVLIFFFPIGLYGLMKSKSFTKKTKTVLTIIFIFYGFAMLKGMFFSNSVTSPSSIITLSDTEKKNEILNNPLNIPQSTFIELLGKKVPYDKWEVWGNPETLPETNNKYWVAYLNKANISLVSNKKTDLILYIGLDKQSGKKFIDELTLNRKKEIEKQFSLWDGSHIKLTALIKESMNNPKSYEHVKTIFIDKDDYLIVDTTFRGENVFGGVVTHNVIAKTDLNGSILEIISE